MHQCMCIMCIYNIFIYAYKLQDMAERSSNEYVGSFLSQKGITSAMLLSHDPAQLTSVEVSNGVVYTDIFLCRHPQCTYHLEDG